METFVHLEIPNYHGEELFSSTKSINTELVFLQQLIIKGHCIFKKTIFPNGYLISVDMNPFN